MMRFEVWVSEESHRAVGIPADEKNKLLLDSYAQFPRYIRDWRFDHSFEAATSDEVNRYMISWVEAQAPQRELTTGLFA